MQITLMEDDGVFFGGIPRNVILVVKFDDGTQMRVPYSAEKSISALYEDLRNILPSTAFNRTVLEPSLTIEDLATLPVKIAELAKDKPSKLREKLLPVPDKSHVIEKEDIVTLVMLDPGRDPGASCDLVVGQEYRVVRVISTGVTLPGRSDITQMVQGYDIVDDHGPRPERTRVGPHEVQLLRKRVPPITKTVGLVEEILHCPTCSCANAMSLDGDVFKGQCASCLTDVEIKRIVKPCLTKDCGNDIALFDEGLQFKGTCNKCKSVMEVPYA